MNHFTFDGEFWNEWNDRAAVEMDYFSVKGFNFPLMWLLFWLLLLLFSLRPHLRLMDAVGPGFFFIYLLYLFIFCCCFFFRFFNKSMIWNIQKNNFEVPRCWIIRTIATKTPVVYQPSCSAAPFCQPPTRALWKVHFFEIVSIFSIFFYKSMIWNIPKYSFDVSKCWIIGSIATKTPVVYQPSCSAAPFCQPPTRALWKVHFFEIVSIFSIFFYKSMIWNIPKYSFDVSKCWIIGSIATKTPVVYQPSCSVASILPASDSDVMEGSFWKSFHFSPFFSIFFYKSMIWNITT